MALALWGVRGRVMRPALALSGVLYLGYSLACRTFFSFQWDILLVEATFLSVWLPTMRRSAWAHLLMRCLLLKLYLESGVCKWESPLGDWQSGAAMTLYFETAPIPTPLALLAHALPAWWHHLESWAVVAGEVAFPLLAFGPRRGRHVAFVGLTLFQAVNAATANYGFFVPLAVLLHLFLLDEADLPGWLRERLGAPAVSSPPRTPVLVLRTALGASLWAVWGSVSLCYGLEQFVGVAVPGWVETLDGVTRLLSIASNYHLFASITTERVEPEWQTWDGAAWTAHDLRDKAGEVHRAPPWVQPHQPRVAFQSWFYGLMAGDAPPEWVQTLGERLCHAPAVVQGLFEAPLPAAPRAVRVEFFQYKLATPGAWWRGEGYWTRTPLGAGPRWSCVN